MTAITAWISKHVFPRLTAVAALSALLSWLVTTHVGQRANREVAAASRLIVTNQQHRATLVLLRFARDNREDLVMISRKIEADNGRNGKGALMALMDDGEYKIMQAFAHDVDKAARASADSDLRTTSQEILNKIAVLEPRMDEGRAKLLQQLRAVASIPTEAGQLAWLKDNGSALEDSRRLIVGALDEGHSYIAELNPVAEWANLDAESRIERWQTYADAADWIAYLTTLLASTAAFVGAVIKGRDNHLTLVR